MVTLENIYSELLHLNEYHLCGASEARHAPETLQKLFSFYYVFAEDVETYFMFIDLYTYST